MDIIIIDPHEVALIRAQELDRIFSNGRGYDTKLKERVRRCYEDDSLRRMPEQTRRQIKERTKAALVIAQETTEFIDEFGLFDGEFESSSSW